jgi:2-oxoglutarate ferredoxin oxidoreductase subunit gamma
MGRTEVRIAGLGGQGVVMMGRILATAAGIYEGKEVSQVETYGMQQRGGAVRSDIVISDGPIDYPEIIKADIMIIMSQESLEKYANDLMEDGILIIDPLHVKKVDDVKTKRIYKVPATEIAGKELGNMLVVNVVMLGALIGITGLLSEKSVKEAIIQTVPKRTIALNIKALEKGLELGKKLRNVYKR